MQAYVTGYNTVKQQTSSHPCIAASGANICGRRDAVACPRRISLGTLVEINGATYVCEDRLAKKYDDRFDISCDKDMACPYQVAGWTTVKVFDETTRAEPLPAAMTVAAAQPTAAARPAVAHTARLHGGLRPRLAKAARRLFAGATQIAKSLGHTT